jgi:hypothetical protein
MLLFAGALSAETKLLVTVVDAKSGESVRDLKASDFVIDDRGSPREVLAAEYSSKPVDSVLLIDASQVGPMVQGIAPGLIEQLGPKEQMAVVAFHTTPDLIQDFTGSKELLHKAAASLKFGNNPDVVGALYATADTGFDNAVERRVILLVSPGLDAGGRVSEEAALKLARKNGVSIFLISPRGFNRWTEEMAKRTGGAAFNLRDVSKTVKNPDKEIGPRIFEAVRGNYTLTLAGNLALGEKLKIEVPGKRKLFISSLPLD